MDIDQLMDDHLLDKNNPHNLKKDDVGLYHVENYPISTIQEAEEGLRDDRYLTPKRLKSVFDGFLKREGLMDKAGNPIIPIRGPSSLT